MSPNGGMRGEDYSHEYATEIKKLNTEIARLEDVITDAAITLSATDVMYSRDAAGQRIFAEHDRIRAERQAAEAEEAEQRAAELERAKAARDAADEKVRKLIADVEKKRSRA